MALACYLTIGNGADYPSGAIRWISEFAGFTNLFLRSYFMVTFKGESAIIPSYQDFPFR
ncbi:MAG TPA: hypothetical protein VE870_03045 [Bacteroidales bacterium]|nr:hypothetical protein [Bacteroidales bacterium]